MMVVVREKGVYALRMAKSICAAFSLYDKTKLSLKTPRAIIPQTRNPKTLNTKPLNPEAHNRSKQAIKGGICHPTVHVSVSFILVPSTNRAYRP